MTSPFKDGLLDGKVAFIAGGTSAASIWALPNAMLNWVPRSRCSGVIPKRLPHAAAEIGHDAIGLTADVRDYGAIRAAMEEVRSKFGLMDIVVSGAAGNFLAPVLGMSANAFKTVVDIDLLGTFNVFRGCHDLLAPNASLIAITAGQAEQPMQLQAHACAAKAGINQLVRVLALEWGPDVRVNGISPGPIEGTEGMARLAPDASTKQKHFDRIAMKRWGFVDEIAEGARCSCRATRPNTSPARSSTSTVAAAWAMPRSAAPTRDWPNPILPGTGRWTRSGRRGRGLAA
jgi:NAD(P)-dependent dehydrogenase (short-subunit alcohol dehydrogenase family)